MMRDALISIGIAFLILFIASAIVVGGFSWAHSKGYVTIVEPSNVCECGCHTCGV